MEYLIFVIFFLLNVFLGIYYYSMCKGKNIEEYQYKLNLTEQLLEEEKNQNKELNTQMDELKKSTIQQTELTHQTQSVDLNDVVILPTSEKVEFDTALTNLSTDSYNLYNEIVNYVKTLENTIILRRKYYEVINFNKGKKIAQLSIKDDKVIIKTNLGKMKVKKGIDPINLKPVKIILTDSDSLEKAKKQIYLSYLRLSGQIGLNILESAGI